MQYDQFVEPLRTSQILQQDFRPNSRRLLAIMSGTA